MPESRKADYDLPIHLIILREDLARRMRANPSYSLRSFAKYIDVDPSLLSKTMNHKRPMSLPLATKILKKLSIEEAEKVLFWKSYLREKQEISGEVTTAPEVSEVSEKYLDQDLFKSISEPHHYALVELTRIKSFSSDLQWISKVLNIPRDEVNAAVTRLVDIGMLEIKNGQISRKEGRFTTQNKSITDSAHKHHQRKILDSAIRALDEVPLERRNQTSMTIAINPKKIPLAKKMIGAFINDLSDVLETGTLEEVYQISFSLYPYLLSSNSKGNS